MRTRWPILALLCVLASWLVPGVASAHAASGAENRVWAFDLAEQVHVAGQHALTLELRQGYELAKYDSASGSLLAAKGGLKLSKTVANHADDIVKKGPFKGQLARPYLNSPLTRQEIMSAAKGVPDPGGVPGALRWDVPGTFRGSQGTWELVVDSADRVLHWNFVR